ncbi:MAG TPA: zf-HC2 domain-containing protein [bacterium]|nr:zf-HC2 domain-containing protein [bacterium]
MRSMHVTDALSAYVDGALREGERTQVERHLETCEDCRRHLSALRDLVATVRSAEPVAAPEGFRAQVRARVEQMDPRPDVARRWPSIPLPWRVVSAAAAVLGIGIFAASLLRTQGPAAMRELDKPGESQIASGDRLRSAAPSAPEVAQRTLPKQRPSVVRGIVLIALPVLALSTLAWIAIRRRRSRRAW